MDASYSVLMLILATSCWMLDAAGLGAGVLWMFGESHQVSRAHHVSFMLGHCVLDRQNTHTQ